MATQPDTKTLGDLTGTRAGTEADIEAIQNCDWRGAVGRSELRAFDGDLTIDGDYSGSRARLIMHGNLDVSGTLGLDETGTLIVTGDVRCRNLYCEGDLEIQGDVTVKETIFGFYEAGITFFSGAVRAALFLQGDHSFEYDDDQLAVTTHLKFDNFRGLSLGTAEEARARLSDEALAELGELLGLSDDDPQGSDDYAQLLRRASVRRVSTARRARRTTSGVSPPSCPSNPSPPEHRLSRRSARSRWCTRRPRELSSRRQRAAQRYRPRSPPQLPRIMQESWPSVSHRRSRPFASRMQRGRRPAPKAPKRRQA